VMICVWTGIALLPALHPRRREPSIASATLVGLMLGAPMLFRVDAALYVVASLIAVCSLSIAALSRRHICALLMGLVPPSLIGLTDAHFFAGSYTRDLSSSLSWLYGAVAVALVLVAGSCSTPLVSRLRRLAAGRRERIAFVVALLAAATLLVGWLVRPSFHAVGTWGLGSGIAEVVARIQRSEGMAVEPVRSYAELTIASMGWYVGPVVLTLAVAGLAWTAWSTVRHLGAPASAIALYLAIAAPVYVIRPNITPDQLWATRRTVTIALPAVILFAVASAELIVARVASRTRRFVSIGVSGLLAAACIAPTIVATWPLRSMSPAPGYHTPFADACDAARDGDAVVEVRSAVLAMPLRAWCDVDAVVLVDDSAWRVASLVSAADAACLGLVFVSTTPLSPEVGHVVDSTRAFELPHRRAVEQTLDRRPVAHIQAGLAIFTGNRRATCSEQAPG
jgi:hypothetical protein